MQCCPLPYSAVQCIWSAFAVPCLCREGAGGDRNTISIFFMNCLSALHCLACTIVCLLQSLFCILVLYFHPLIFQSERRGFYFSRINQWPVHPYTSVESLFACATGIEPVPPYNIFWSESSVQALLKDNLHSYSILTSENLGKELDWQSLHMYEFFINLTCDSQMRFLFPEAVPTQFPPSTDFHSFLSAD